MLTAERQQKEFITIRQTDLVRVKLTKSLNLQLMKVTVPNLLAEHIFLKQTENSDR